MKPPPIPRFVDTNVLRIHELKLTPALPKGGDSVTINLTILNESPAPLSNVEWRLSGALAKEGKVELLAPRAKVTITQTITAQVGKLRVTAEVDPQRRVNEPAEHRANNTVKLSAAVSAGGSGWATWASKAASKLDEFIDFYKQATSVEGKITGPILSVTKLRIASGNQANVQALKGKLTAEGVPADVAEAIAVGFAKSFEGWASKYRAVVPAYPAFAAWPAPQGGPIPNVPFPLAAGGSWPASAATITSDMKAQLSSSRRSEAGADDALRDLGETISGKLEAWVFYQLVARAMGRGPVPGYSFTAPVGPVVSGFVEPAASHLP